MQDLGPGQKTPIFHRAAYNIRAQGNVGFVLPLVALCSVLLDAGLRCLMAIKNVGRKIEHFFCLTLSFDAKVSNSRICMH